MIKTKRFFLVSLSVLLFFFLSNKCVGHIAQNNLTDFVITDYGAIPDGITLNTQSIQKAIDDAFKNKGGRVVFPKGQFLSGSIQLKSNVTLSFEEESVLLGSTNPEDYIKMDFPGRPESPKKDDNSQLALILAHKANNIQLISIFTV